MLEGSQLISMLVRVKSTAKLMTIAMKNLVISDLFRSVWSLYFSNPESFQRMILRIKLMKEIPQETTTPMKIDKM